MFRFEILDSRIVEDRRRWTEVWESSPNQSPFAHPTYAQLFASEEDVPFAAHMVTPAGGEVLYVFVRRPIPLPSDVDYYDTTTPYGYGGAYVWGPGDREEAGGAFWEHFDAWARESGIVSEFIRFDVLGDHLLPYPGATIPRGNNVLRSLDGTEEDRWANYEHKVRKNVSRARRSGITVVVDDSGERLEDFMRIYDSTMERREAETSYLFPRRLFEQMLTDMGAQCVFFHALHEGAVVSTELVLVSAEATFSFLGGTDSEFFGLRPNDLLKHEIITWSAEQGKEMFVLGGGAAAGDGIERYKKAFAPDGIRVFSTGQRIFDASAYEKLTDLNERRMSPGVQSEGSASSRFFPAYRAPAS